MKIDLYRVQQIRAIFQMTTMMAMAKMTMIQLIQMHWMTTLLMINGTSKFFLRVQWYCMSSTSDKKPEKTCCMQNKSCLYLTKVSQLIP